MWHPRMCYRPGLDTVIGIEELSACTQDAGIMALIDPS
jgi:hypothetical protein